MKAKGTADNLEIVEDKYEALSGCEALVTMTEWREFKIPNFDRVKEGLNQQLIFDARNLYDSKKVRELGFDYYSIGKQ